MKITYEVDLIDELIQKRIEQKVNGTSEELEREIEDIKKRLDRALGEWIERE